jgi:hypothetical protein
MKRHLFGIFVGILAFTSAVLIYHHSAYSVGIIEAYIDLLQGKYILKAFDGGIYAAEKDEYNNVLKEYGVELIVIEGCTVTEELREEIMGYNSVSVSAIDKKYGKMIWQRLSERFGRPTHEEKCRRSREYARWCESLK